MVSHREAIREAYNQQMEYDPADSRWLIQGILKHKNIVPYSELPWKLGIIKLID